MLDAGQRGEPLIARCVRAKRHVQASRGLLAGSDLAPQPATPSQTRASPSLHSHTSFTPWRWSETDALETDTVLDKDNDALIFEVYDNPNIRSAYETPTELKYKSLLLRVSKCWTLRLLLKIFIHHTMVA